MRTGVDLIEIARFNYTNPAIRQRFIKRVFTQNELGADEITNEVFAGLFAAKEAVSKALGSGIGEVSWQEIEILHGPDGEPGVFLKGQARERAEKLGLSHWSVSISHSASYAMAVVIATGEKNEDPLPE